MPRLRSSNLLTSANDMMHSIRYSGDSQQISVENDSAFRNGMECVCVSVKSHIRQTHSGNELCVFKMEVVMNIYAPKMFHIIPAETDIADGLYYHVVQMTLFRTIGRRLIFHLYCHSTMPVFDITYIRKEHLAVIASEFDIDTAVVAFKEATF